MTNVRELSGGIPGFDVSEPGLELAMQELEALEAPGWWTAAGVAAGIGATALASYIGVTIATT